jgi:tRNA A37 methylthiotransferase MiaB
VSALVEELTAQRAEDRHGETVEVLVEAVLDTAEGLVVEGRAAHQAPEVDGSTALVDGEGLVSAVRVGQLVTATVVGSDGVDLVARVSGPVR